MAPASQELEPPGNPGRFNLAGETLHGLATRHDLSRNLIRIWIEKYQAGGLDEDVVAADLLQSYEARIAALERLVGKQALELDPLKGGSACRTPAEKRHHVRHHRPGGLSIAQGCRADGHRPLHALRRGLVCRRRHGHCRSDRRDLRRVRSYGWRRVRVALRQQGLVVNHKKVRRLMREHDLQPKVRPRYTATTDSDHDQPIFPNLADGLVLDGPDQLWVADIIYVPVIGGFVYVAIVLDSWSRRVVGYAMSRSIDIRLSACFDHVDDEVACLWGAVPGTRPACSLAGFNQPRPGPP